MRHPPLTTPTTPPVPGRGTGRTATRPSTTLEDALRGLAVAHVADRVVAAGAFAGTSRTWVTRFTRSPLPRWVFLALTASELHVFEFRTRPPGFRRRVGRWRRADVEVLAGDRQAFHLSVRLAGRRGVSDLEGVHRSPSERELVTVLTRR